MSRLQDCVTVEAALRIVKSEAVVVELRKLPDYDKGLSTRTFMIIGLTVSYSFGIASLIAGTYILSTPSSTMPAALQDQSWDTSTVPAGFSGWVSLSPIYAKIIGLFFVLLVASLTECMGYIHTVTLRWALAREGRLYFNSNLRLFSAARSSFANGWLANSISASLLVVCFSAATQILVPVATPGDAVPNSWISLNGIALLFLGIGLIGLAIITTIGMAKAERKGLILSWNPNAFNTTLACQHSGALTRKSGRSMKPAALAADSFAKPIIPAQKQPSARTTLALIRCITRFLWIVFFLALALAISVCIVLYINYSKNYFDYTSWFFIDDVNLESKNEAAILMIPVAGGHTLVHLFASFLWTVMLTGFSTMALHAAELLVNLRRDESDWRKASSKKGASFMSGAFAAAIANKGSSFLFCFKPFLQWVYGLGIFVWIDPALEVCTIIINPVAILVLLVLVLALAIFASVYANISPRGYQPSTYGHLQTLADLIDEWCDSPTDKLFWGDKGIVLAGQDNKIAVRRAGTSNKKCKVADIVPNASYA